MMMGEMLTTNSTILCPHGGKAVLVTSNTKVFSRGAPVLLETDVHPVAGCPFTLGPKYSPCIRITWKAGQTDTLADGVPVLCVTSIGTCYNAEGAPQGIAVIVAP
jgi:hypothetical protein